VFDCLGEVIEAHLKKNGAGEFVLPGLLKISSLRKPATEARTGINPFTIGGNGYRQWVDVRAELCKLRPCASAGGGCFW